ncbi:MAG TPA: KamA family radical SAM protein [Bacteroidales bacterium]|nr:KamA family radical SAM protein [Bacteroidales bacterium]
MNVKIIEETSPLDDEVPLQLVGYNKISENVKSNLFRLKKTEFSTISPQTKNFIQKHFPNTPEEQWNSWRWQIKNSFTTFEQLSEVVDVKQLMNEAFIAAHKKLPLRITPYYASLLEGADINNPIFKGVVPSIKELQMSPGEASDPLHEEKCSPVPNIVHRYPDRVLFLATGFCSTYCRYCTRSHMVSKEKVHYGKAAWQEGIEYVRNNKNVRDVLISGGDPLTMPEAHLEYLLESLRNISHVEIIRIGTKVPVVLPQRITNSFVNMLRRYHPLFMSIHFMHPMELTPEVEEACSKLANAGIPLGSQTVLLKGINDSVTVMTKLMQGLLKNRVRPYYIYQCDPIPGSGHFRTSVEKGLEIIKGLRGFTSGYAVPHFVIDAPGGGGKIPLLPEYYIGRDENNVILLNYEGKKYYYPDAPVNYK